MRQTRGNRTSPRQTIKDKERTKTMEGKFKIRITRVETYTRDVEVEADSLEAALAMVEDREADNEYAEMFDMPDDVKTSFAEAEQNA